MIRIDFAARFQAAFGYIAGRYGTGLRGGFAEVVKDSDLNLPYYVVNENATFDEVLLTHGKQSYLFAYRSIAEDYTDVFATPPMIELSRKKNITTTPIDNVNDVEIVERFNTEPWSISLKGLLIDMENHSFPLSKIQELNEIFEVNEPWDVHSEILRAVGVYALYIKSISINFLEGFEDTVEYAIEAKACTPYVYQLKNQ